MKITLKKIKIAEHLSEETTAFTAEVCLDGKVVGYANNSGHGGPTNVQPYKDFREVLDKMEEYCKGLPPVVFGSSELKMDLEFFVDIIIEEHIKQKEEKRLELKLNKDMLKGICIKTPQGYSLISWKGHTIKSMLSIPVLGKKTIKDKVADLVSKGETILNTNLDLVD